MDFGRDFEQQLTFYVDARAAFPNLDLTFATLVQCVVKLAMDTRKIVKGQHSRKTGAFVKACAAYCFITIPSIVSVMTRLDLYLLAGQIALVNLCLGQGEWFFIFFYFLFLCYRAQCSSDLVQVPFELNPGFLTGS